MKYRNWKTPAPLALASALSCKQALRKGVSLFLCPLDPCLSTESEPVSASSPHPHRSSHPTPHLPMGSGGTRARGLTSALLEGDGATWEGPGTVARHPALPTPSLLMNSPGRCPPGDENFGRDENFDNFGGTTFGGPRPLLTTPRE